MQHAVRDSQSQEAPFKVPPNDNKTYRIMVLRLSQSEEEIDRQFLQTALNLGINIPQSPRTTLDLVTHDVSTLNLSPERTPEPSVPLSSRASDSTHRASDSSVERRRHTKTPSLAATSITSVPSTSSVTSKKSNYVRIKKGIRRISTLRRRKTLGTQAPDTLLSVSTTYLPRPALHPRAATADHVPTTNQLQPHALTTNETQMGTTRRRQISSASHTSLPYRSKPPFPPPTHRPPPLPREPHLTPQPVTRPPVAHRTSSSSAESIEAQRRSLGHPVLKKLRTVQLQEQLRFISFQASQNRLMRTSHLQSKRDALTSFKERQASLENAHADALSSLEHRQLSAEIDLRKGLEAEKRACDTRLKHMQAYCNPKSNVAGMPRREVTKSDYQQLEQQYHLRNSMDILHTSRINVLREKQAKQLERVAGKQEAELERVEGEYEKENADLDIQFRAEEVSLREEFAARRRRLVRRWDLAEAIERKKLEIELGDEFGRLPPIEWGEQATAEDDTDNSLHDGRSRTGSEGSGKEYDIVADVSPPGIPDVEVMYDAMNMNMI